VRRTGALIFLLPLLASCGILGASDEHRYQMMSPAMEPTIPRDGTATATVIKPGEYRPADGDIVVFRPPSGWAAENADAPRIYRVVAIGGETIECCDTAGHLMRNGTAVDEPYVDPVNKTEPIPKLKIPQDQVYVLGDNRSSAADSSVHGPIPASAVIGKVKLN
jgi:signal peptidase I